MDGWADVVLAVTALAPLGAVVVAMAVALPADDQRWTTLGCAVAAAGALVLLVTGQHPSVARLAPDDLALAAAFATALLALGARAATRAPVLGGMVTIALCGLTAGTTGRPSTVGPALALAGLGVLLVVQRDVRHSIMAAIGASAVVVAAGLHSGGRGGAAAVIAGVAAVAVAGSSMPRRAAIVVVPTALTLGLRIAPVLSGTATARWVAVVLGVGATLVVAAPVVVERWPVPAACAALVPWVLIAALEPVPGTSPAARVLAAGAVFALLLGGPLGLIAGLPGAALLAPAIADGGGWPRAALGLLLAATVAGLLFGRPVPARVHLRVVDGIALALAAWLVVRPTAWAWAHVAGADAYSDGTVLAVASGLIAGVLMAVGRGSLDLTEVGPWLLIGEEDTEASRGLSVLTLVATVALGTAAAALLRSARL